MERYRVRYIKKGMMKYISHLDLINYFSRLMVRANVDVEFTQGYNPKVKFEFGPALPVGFESEYEYFNMFPKQALDEKKLLKLLNSKGIPNLTIKEIKNVENRKLSRTIDGFKFFLKILKKNEKSSPSQIEDKINQEYLEDGGFLKKDFIISINVVKSCEDFLEVEWITNFRNGQYGSPKAITKLEEFKDFYLDCNKTGIMWKKF